VISLAEPRSRLYDIWSMGCILLEFIIWLLYGYNELKRFNQEIQDTQFQDSPYFTVLTERGDGKKTAVVHSEVRKWITYISKDPKCSGDPIVKALLKLVDEKMLVV
jgi:hypothetical protein